MLYLFLLPLFPLAHTAPCLVRFLLSVVLDPEQSSMTIRYRL